MTTSPAVSPLRHALASRMTEAELLSAVREACKTWGAQLAHFGDSRKEVRDRKTGEARLIGDQDSAGFFDLVIVTADARLLFRELKTERGRLRPEQEEWWRWLLRCGADAGVWRPSALLDGSVDRELRG